LGGYSNFSKDFFENLILSVRHVLTGRQNKLRSSLV
jgi:hypothetical protein